jgi:hypothetical protein
MRNYKTIIFEPSGVGTFAQYEEWLEEMNKKEGFELISVITIGVNIIVTYEIIEIIYLGDSKLTDEDRENLDKRLALLGKFKVDNES